MIIIVVTTGDIKNIVDHCGFHPSPWRWKLVAGLPPVKLAATSVGGNLGGQIFSLYETKFKIFRMYSLTASLAFYVGILNRKHRYSFRLC